MGAVISTLCTIQCDQSKVRVLKNESIVPEENLRATLIWVMKTTDIQDNEQQCKG